MSVLAAVVVSLIFGPFTVLAFLVDPAGFLARNGALAVCYLSVASLGTILYVAFGVRIAAAIKRRKLSVRESGSSPGVRTSK